MPLHIFSCECGFRFEELFWQNETVPRDMACRCGKRARRNHAYRFRIVGPVFEKLEDYERVLFTPRERAAGARIRSKADIERVEREQGIHREDETFYRVARDEMRHEEYQIKEVQREGGVGAALDFVDDLNIRDETGWSQKELTDWKEATDAAEKAVTDSAA